MARSAVWWCRIAVVGGLMLAAFTFNTTENLPIGLLNLISSGLRVSPSAVSAATWHQRSTYSKREDVDAEALFALAILSIGGAKDHRR